MRFLLLVSLMLFGVGQARAAIGSYNSVYYSSYCQQYKCVLEDRGFSHTFGDDFGQFKYRLFDGSVLIQHRDVPFDAFDISPSYDVEVLTLELSKKLNVAQLERRLTELVNYGTGANFSNFAFDLAHKCNRPIPPPNAYPWNDEFGRSHTFKVRGEHYELTCVWSRGSWAFYLHQGIVFPTFRSLKSYSE